MGGSDTTGIALLALVVGAVVFLGALRIAVARFRARRGTRVSGVVMSCERRLTGGGPGEGPGVSFGGVVRFRDPGTGAAHEERIAFGGRRAVGSEVSLCYPPNRPDRVQEFGHWAAGLLLVPFLVVGLVFFFGGLADLIG